MKRTVALLLALALLGFAAGGCGGTSTGRPGEGTGGVTGGQDTEDQPEAGGLKTPAYTAAHNVCSLYPLDELARQNNVEATPEAVADKVSEAETDPKAKEEAKQGCLDGLANK